MMAHDDILRSLYFGELTPWEIRHPTPPEQKDLCTAYESKVKQLMETLPKEQTAVLEAMLNDRAVTESEAICNGFVDGFKMGVRMMLAVMEVSDG